MLSSKESNMPEYPDWFKRILKNWELLDQAKEAKEK